MNKIASFTVNHLNLLTGVYVSRRDYIGDEVITTFDLRFTRPNEEAPMDTAGIHSIEHLGATFLRNDPEWRRMADYILSYEGDIPGYSPRDCGNYLDNNLKLAKIYMNKYKTEVLDAPTPDRMKYPQ